MAEPSLYRGVKHVVHLSTNLGTMCEHCDKRVGLDDFAESVNHYVDAHGYKVLHVGPETSWDTDGRPWHSTVAVVGR